MSVDHGKAVPTIVYKKRCVALIIGSDGWAIPLMILQFTIYESHLLFGGFNMRACVRACVGYSFSFVFEILC